VRRRRPSRPSDGDGGYRQLSAVIPTEGARTAERVVRTLGALGALAQPLGDGRTSLTALFDAAAADEKLVDHVRRELARSGIRVAGNVRLVDVTGGDWAEAWPEYLFPVPVGRRLLITPPWIDRLETERTVIVIEPGGFGTGHHPTTVGCLEALDRLIGRRPPRQMIDLGTGSGILAIAAVRLGVAGGVAVDEDAGAIACATANAAANGVGDRLRFIAADAAAVELDPAPLVIANLLAPIHRRLAARYAGIVAPAGSLVLGGIETARAREVRSAIEASGFALAGQRAAEDWTTLVFRRKAQ
jgi:ribosomal protein L11 methyltransferase